MIDDPLFYVLAIPAFVAIGISKGGFGGGLGSLAVPLMALAVPVPQAAAIMLPLLMVMDVIGLWAYRTRWDRENMRIIMPGACLGLYFGYLAFRLLPEAFIRLMIGAIALGFAAQHFRRHGRPATPSGRSWLKGSFWSAVAGLVSFVANAGGPPLAVYLLPQRLDKTLYVGTTVIFFAVVNALKVLPFWWLGQFTAENLLTAAVLLPLAPLGMWLGIWLHDKVSEAAFYRWVYALMFLTGLKLAWDGAIGLG